MKKIMLGLLALLLAMPLLGCGLLEPDQEQMVQEFFVEWYGGQIRRQAWATLTGTRDPESEAVIGASMVIMNLHEADKLMEEGRRDEDPTKMDQAIQRRPEDWTYRVSRAALALQQDDLDTYAQQSEAAEAIVEANAIDPLWHTRRTVSDLEYAESRLRMEGWKSPKQCLQLYLALESEYTRLHEATGDAAYATRAEWALERYATCP